MSLRLRLILMGALLPTACLVLALSVGGWFFNQQLLHRMDDGLRGQAALELVSLVDDAVPHLHAGLTPDTTHRAWAASTALYRADGSRMLTSRAWMPEHWQIESKTWPVTRSVDDQRELALRTEAGDGRFLVLRAPLDGVRATVATYWMVTGIATLSAFVLLAFMQSRAAWLLEQRLTDLSSHMSRLGAGDLRARPPPDDHADVIGRLRDQIAQASEQLEAFDTTRERFLANAAHELRTPLACIGANIDVALRRERDAPALREALAATRIETDRLAVLSSQLLDFAQLGHQALHTHDTDLAQLLRESIDAARGVAEARQVALMLRAPACAMHPVDPIAMRQAIDNLLSNAVRHAPGESVVEVRVSRTPLAWLIDVNDVGAGISESIRDVIFEPFVSGPDGGGTGLGLAIVQRIIHAHDGQIRLRDGPGARFRVTLPTQDPTGAPATVAPV